MRGRANRWRSVHHRAHALAHDRIHQRAPASSCIASRVEWGRTIGHMEPCLAQFAILSNVARVYSTPFFGCSSDCWLLPSLAMSNASRVAGTPAAGEDEEEESERAEARSEGAVEGSWRAGRLEEESAGESVRRPAPGRRVSKRLRR